MKEIKIFEFFSGIGSQIKALRSLEKEFNFQSYSLGACDFYIDAIISYMSIHHGLLEQENKLSRNEMIQLLSSHNFSSDSKKVVSNNYFKKMNEEKLRKIFPYLFSFVNNNYFYNKYKLEQRERENETDIRNFKFLPKNIDILTYSFPCQDLSQQGKQKGLNKNTRSGLLYEIERILKDNSNNLPKVLLLENVKALVSKKFINEFNEWIKILENLGYKSSWKVINSADFGSSQNRERVFMVSILGNKTFSFENNFRNYKNVVVKQIWQKNYYHKSIKLESNQSITNKIKTKNNISKSFINNYTNFNSENYLYYLESKGPTLTASGANSRLKFLVDNEVLIMNGMESYLYMGFDKSDFNKVEKTKLLSENRIIFTAGNSISVEVLRYLFEKMIKDGIL